MQCKLWYWKLVEMLVPGTKNILPSEDQCQSLNTESPAERHLRIFFRWS